MYLYEYILKWAMQIRQIFWRFMNLQYLYRDLKKPWVSIPNINVQYICSFRQSIIDIQSKTAIPYIPVMRQWALTVLCPPPHSAPLNSSAREAITNAAYSIQVQLLDIYASHIGDWVFMTNCKISMHLYENMF